MSAGLSLSKASIEIELSEPGLASGRAGAGGTGAALVAGGLLNSGWLAGAGCKAKVGRKSPKGLSSWAGMAGRNRQGVYILAKKAALGIDVAAI